ncbi:twin-arginine translocase TatA/TatE family subunit [Enemella dayhoffiae]|uniref:Sec-independent protein translocase protein TatA n=1 Tax=Enemella dayhoffiae TaxID=2016507 RepID=A0A255H3A5_9ACTN|nr:twin-arginine translocase TatA/TatE family subunit [Enemella dayhoffiae]
MLGLGTTELLIILAVVLLLFGGSRLAGLGRSSGRAIREFKEETRDLKGNEKEGGSTAVDQPRQLDRPAEAEHRPTTEPTKDRNPEDLR